MNYKYRVGDYFIFIKKYSSGEGYHFVGQVTGVFLENHRKFMYKVLKDTGTYSTESITKSFSVGSCVYDESKIITEKEAIIEVL